MTVVRVGSFTTYAVNTQTPRGRAPCGADTARQRITAFSGVRTPVAARAGGHSGTRLLSAMREAGRAACKQDLTPALPERAFTELVPAR